MSPPTARKPWTVTIAWTPDQNFGRVSTMPGRTPLYVIVGRLRAGEPPQDVADDFGLAVEQVEVLRRFADEVAAFPLGRSVGTRGCMALATEAVSRFLSPNRRC